MTSLHQIVRGSRALSDMSLYFLTICISVKKLNLDFVWVDTLRHGNQETGFSLIEAEFALDAALHDLSRLRGPSIHLN